MNATIFDNRCEIHEVAAAIYNKNKWGWGYDNKNCIPMGVYTRKAFNFIGDMVEWKCMNWTSIPEAYKLFGLFAHIKPSIKLDKYNETYVIYGPINPITGESMHGLNWTSSNLKTPQFDRKENTTYFDLIKIVATWHRKKYAQALKDYYNYVKPSYISKAEFNCLYTYLYNDNYKMAYDKYGKETFKVMIGDINPEIKENQFIIESTKVLEQELVALVNKYMQYFNVWGQTRCHFQEKIYKKLTPKYMEIKKMLHDYQFTF